MCYFLQEILIHKRDTWSPLTSRLTSTRGGGSCLEGGGGVGKKLDFRGVKTPKGEWPPIFPHFFVGGG